MLLSPPSALKSDATIKIIAKQIKSRSNSSSSKGTESYTQKKVFVISAGKSVKMLSVSCSRGAANKSTTSS